MKKTLYLLVVCVLSSCATVYLSPNGQQIFNDKKTPLDLFRQCLRYIDFTAYHYYIAERQK